MSVISRGFSGRRRPGGDRLPPGQYLESGFPVLSAGPTQHVDTATWQFTIATETGDTRRWDWQQFTSLPREDITVDIHCVTKWSKRDTRWRGVSVDTLLDGVETTATGLDLMTHDRQGFWEQLGYHDYGDPWREQRYQGD